MISLCVPLITHPASLLTANKRLCVCHGIRITLRCVSLSLSLPPFSCPCTPPTPILTTAMFVALSPCFSATSTSLFFPATSPPLSVFARCVRHCRLALDDAIRHTQLNISRFSPRVAGESDFLQTVINKVITAKEVNHKGQGNVSASHSGKRRHAEIPE